MQRYEQYKASGLDWMAEVPSHWQVVANRALFRERQEAGEEGLPVLSVSLHTGVSDDEQDEEENARTRTRMADRTSYKRVRPGDVAYNMMRAWQGAIGAVRTDGLVSPAYVVAAPTTALNPAYFEYLYRTDWLIGEMNRASKGITDFRKRLYWQEFKQLSTVVPPREEQDRIVAFLNQKTAELDAAIAKKERLIELLHEQQAILIDRAVKQGLGLRAVDSKNEEITLGSAPLHWSKVKLKSCIEILSGFAFKSAGYTNDDTDIPLLRGVNINPGQLNWRETVYWSKSKKANLAGYFLAAGDLVIGMDRPWVADGIRVAAVSSENLPCLLLQRVARLRAKKGITQGYLELVLTSKAFLSYFEPMLTGISVPHISPEQIGNYEANLPPLDEQESICAYVDGLKNQYKIAIAKATKAKESLIELKSILVSCVVTGKIKV